MQLARPSYSDMAALIELGETLLFKCFNFDLECLFLESCFCGGFRQQLCFWIAHGPAAE